MAFPGEYRVEWMSPEETYMHLENTGSKIYRGLVETVGMKKSAGEIYSVVVVIFKFENMHLAFLRSLN